MRGFICNKCGKSWREKEYYRTSEISLNRVQVFMDDFLGSHGLDLCPECSAVQEKIRMVWYRKK